MHRPMRSEALSPHERLSGQRRRMGAHTKTAAGRAETRKKMLRPKWIYDFQKRELIEIGIPRADAPDTVFAHENCRVRVV